MIYQSLKNLPCVTGYFRQYIVICLVAICLATVSVLQARPYNTLEIRGLSTVDGLSDLVVSEIYRAPSGYVYFGTDLSVDRFDGVHFKTYPVPGDNPRLKRVTDITSVASGAVYAATGQGLFRLNDAGGELVRECQSELNFSVNDLAARGDTLLIGSDRGLYVFDTSTGHLDHFMPAAGAFSIDNRITGVNYDSSDPANVWLTSHGNLYMFNLGSRDFITYRYDNEAQIESVARHGNELYLGTARSGVIKFDITGRTFSYYTDCGHPIVTSLSVSPQGLLSVGTDGGGVRLIDTATGEIVRSLTHTSAPNSDLRSNSVYSTLIDSAGLLWIGYYQSGVDYTLYQRRLFDTYANDSFSTANMTVRALAIDGDEILIGTRDGLYYYNKATGVARTFETPRLRSNMIFSICKYRGLYCVTTYGGGMYVLDTATMSLRDFAPDVPALVTGNVFTQAIDPDGHLWIGTDNGVYRYDGRKLVAHFTSTNSALPAGNVYEIFFDSAGTGWICTENGVGVYINGAIQADAFPPQLNHKAKYREVYEDSRHRLYFVPDRGIIIRTDLRLKDFTEIKMPNVNSSFMATFVIEDRDGGLWIGSSDGLCRFDDKGEFVHFSYADGLPGSMFTLCKPVLDADGTLWMGNSAGLVTFQMSRLDEIHHHGDNITITDVLVNGKSVYNGNPDEIIRLESGLGNLTALFSDFSYTSPPYMMYEYRIDRDDTPGEWIMLRGKSEANFYSLPPGHYRLGVRRIGEPETQVWQQIHVAAPINYGSLILLTLFVGACGVAGWLWIWMRRHRRSVLQAAQLHQEVDADAVPADDSEKYRTTRLSDEECRRLQKRLKKVMDERRLYTNPSLTVGELAQAVDSTAHSLSFLFNQYMHTSYYDYINALRVEAFRQMIADGEADRYTLAAMSEKCGFSSRASFFRNFKKIMQVTPAEYIRTHHS